MMKMQGNTTEIDERNLLRLDALLSHGYGLSPQLVMRSKGLSIEAKALYGYLSSFAGAGDTAFPSTSRILEELDISKNRFYKIRKELVSWGFISIETTATSAGLRTVYTLPQNPIAIKTEIDEIANRRNEIKSSLVANLHNEDMVSHKGDSESERLQQSAGNEPCRQSEAKAQNRGSNLKPCLQSEDEGCLQSGDKLYIDTNINPKVSIDRSAAHPSDDEGPSDWKVTEGMTDPTQRDDGESDRDANRRDALDAVPDGTYDPLPTVADGYTLSNSEFEAFNHLCSLSIKTVSDGQPDTGSPQTSVLITITAIIIKESTQNSTPTTEANESGATENPVIPSTEYLNSFHMDHLVFPAERSILSYCSHFVRNPTQPKIPFEKRLYSLISRTACTIFRFISR